MKGNSRRRFKEKQGKPRENKGIQEFPIPGLGDNTVGRRGK
jgi:hypothetical protein